MSISNQLMIGFIALKHLESPSYLYLNQYAEAWYTPH